MCILHAAIVLCERESMEMGRERYRQGKGRERGGEVRL